MSETGYAYASSGMPGAPQAGPEADDVAQGACALDVASSLATINNALGTAGFIAGAFATPSAPIAVAQMFAGVGGLVAAASAAFDASPACQSFDNAETANTLGLGAIVAP
ncbi:MAG: hypothetical protein ACKOUS_04800 [Alphaproteobacteria bacterium]